MIVYSLAKWKEITSRDTSADQVADILRSWEAQNKMLHWELLQLQAFIEEHGNRKLLAHRCYKKLLRKIYNILLSHACVSVVDLIRGLSDWTPPEEE